MELEDLGPLLHLDPPKLVDDAVLQTWIGLLTDLRARGIGGSYGMDGAVSNLITYSRDIAVQLNLRRQQEPQPHNLLFLIRLFESSHQATQRGFRDHIVDILSVAGVDGITIESLIDPNNQIVDTHLSDTSNVIVTRDVTGAIRRFRHILHMGPDPLGRSPLVTQTFSMDDDQILEGRGDRYLPLRGNPPPPIEWMLKRRRNACLCIGVILFAFFTLIILAILATIERRPRQTWA